MRLTIAVVGGLLAAALAAGAAQEGDGKDGLDVKRRTDVGKKRIEQPLKDAIRNGAPDAPEGMKKLERRDVGKGVVEMPLKESLRIPEILSALQDRQTAQPADAGKREVELPVKQAMVPAPARPAVMKAVWHPSVEKAAEAARASGKPLLVFHLLGDLTEEFC